MPRRDKVTYLNDILKACSELEVLYQDAGTMDTFLTTNYFYRTAERCFQIIGEALYRINNIDCSIGISNKEKIIRLRHLLTHDYDMIEYQRLWIYITTFLPQLKQEIAGLLENEQPL